MKEIWWVFGEMAIKSNNVAELIQCPDDVFDTD